MVGKRDTLLIAHEQKESNLVKNKLSQTRNDGKSLRYLKKIKEEDINTRKPSKSGKMT